MDKEGIDREEFFQLPNGVLADADVRHIIALIVRHVTPSVASILDRRNFESMRIESGLTLNSRRISLVKAHENTSVEFILQWGNERVNVILQESGGRKKSAYIGG